MRPDVVISLTNLPLCDTNGPRRCLTAKESASTSVGEIISSKAMLSRSLTPLQPGTSRCDPPITHSVTKNSLIFEMLQTANQQLHVAFTWLVDPFHVTILKPTEVAHYTTLYYMYMCSFDQTLGNSSP